MAKVNANYEVVYILKPDLDEEAITALVERFKTMAEQRGSVAEVDQWGKRHLAYPIDDITEGYYVLMTITTDPEFPAELERVMRINESVMRSLIVCKDE